MLDKDQIKQMRTIGHNLKPVVMVGDNGFSEGVVNELKRALSDHELIKVKLNVEDKKQAIIELCETTNAELVQAIGKVALIYLHNPKANPKLSNLAKNI